MLRRLEILVRQSADPPILNTEQDSVYRSILDADSGEDYCGNNTSSCVLNFREPEDSGPPESLGAGDGL